MGRESRTKVSGPRAEKSGSQEPGEEAGLEPGSERPAGSRGGRDRGTMTSEGPASGRGRGEPGSQGTWGRGTDQDLREHGEGGQELRGQG